MNPLRMPSSIATNASSGISIERSMRPSLPMVGAPAHSIRSRCLQSVVIRTLAIVTAPFVDLVLFSMFVHGREVHAGHRRAVKDRGVNGEYTAAARERVVCREIDQVLGLRRVDRQFLHAVVCRIVTPGGFATRGDEQRFEFTAPSGGENFVQPIGRPSRAGKLLVTIYGS